MTYCELYEEYEKVRSWVDEAILLHSSALRDADIVEAGGNTRLASALRDGARSLEPAIAGARARLNELALEFLRFGVNILESY